MTAHERTRAGSLTSATLGAGLALAASTTTACASNHSGSTAAGPAGSATTSAVSAPHITVERSGGFAGFKDTIDVAPGGSWTATDKSGGKTGGDLSTSQAGQIRSLAADPRIAAEAAQARGATKCRDAFNYVLTVGTVRVVFVDCPADPDQPAASLALVKQVLQATIQPPR